MTPKMTKMVMCGILGATICFATYGGFQWYEVKKARHAEIDAILAQGGYLVAIHRSLSKSDKSYRQRQLMGMLASEVDAKIQANEAYIVKTLPPDSLQGFRDMSNRLHELAAYAMPARLVEEAEQAAPGQPLPADQFR